MFEYRKDTHRWDRFAILSANRAPKKQAEYSSSSSSSKGPHVVVVVVVAVVIVINTPGGGFSKTQLLSLDAVRLAADLIVNASHR